MLIALAIEAHPPSQPPSVARYIQLPLPLEWAVIEGGLEHADLADNLRKIAEALLYTMRGGHRSLKVYMEIDRTTGKALPRVNNCSVMVEKNFE